MRIKKILFSLMLVAVLAASPAAAQEGQGQPLVNMPSFAPVVEKTEAAVVNIIATKTVKGSDGARMRPPFGGGIEGDIFDRFFERFPQQQQPQGRDRKATSGGSGFIFDPEGFVITNNHVIDGAEDIKVKLSNGQEIQAEVIGRDPKTDVALLKLKKAGKYPFLALGDSDKVRIGDWVIAIGNPFGLEHTVTAGILSARGRSFGVTAYEDFLQFDAPINFGNSGGPLLNVYGEVIGINSAILASGGGGNVGIGFAIPANLAKSVVTQLKDKGKVVRGWMGVVIQKVTPEIAELVGLDSPRGALVGDISPEGPAVAAKLQRKDIILKFDGRDINDFQDLPLIVANTEIGKKVKVVVFRDKKEVTLDLTVAEMKDDPGELDSPASGVGKLGLTFKEITPDAVTRFNFTEKEGIYIAGVEPGSPAAEAGLAVGDVVVEIEDKPLKNRADYIKALSGKKKDDLIMLLVKRGSNTMFFTVKVSE